MPTKSGGMTADEKREAERKARREARLSVTAQIATPEWYAAEADSYVAEMAAHDAEVAAGTKSTYSRVERWYPVGEEFPVKVGRRTIKVDEGEARAYGVEDELEKRGIKTGHVMSFGLYAGRNTVKYGFYASKY